MRYTTLATATLATMGIMGAGVASAAPAPAAAAPAPVQCAEPMNERFYPAMIFGQLGEVSVNIQACNDTDPSAWSVTTDSHTNGTGDSLGFSIDSKVVYESIGQQSRKFDVEVTLKECFSAGPVPFCDTVAGWTVHYDVTDINDRVSYDRTIEETSDDKPSGYELQDEQA